MSDFSSIGQIDSSAVYRKIMEGTPNQSYDIMALIILLKNLGYSKKRIKSEIKKYKKSRNRMLSNLRT